VSPSDLAVTATAPRVRSRATIEGTVQGVGFRPFVYRLATEERLAGHVLNDARGVVLEVEGGADAVERFLRRLIGETPPLAVIESVVCDRLTARGEQGFAIVESRRSGSPDAAVTPDSATCADCLAELFSPSDRRFRYPFINCTNCGPRFTIVRGVPYDRPLTSMAPFAMCDDCRSEYDDPGDRRFHAQPNACPQCGPAVHLLDRYGQRLETADPLAFAATRLREGFVVALKGLGGFHLACDAADERAVAALRRRKVREDKPFALMVADCDAADEFVELGAEERQLLESVQRPIVLAPRLANAAVAEAVAPAIPELGLMLPYTPLHHLLLSDFGTGALVMTSANVSDEPIAFRDDDALARLASIADLFLLHDREIETRTDDSVVRVVSVGDRRRPLPLRRSRGYTPAPLELVPALERGLLACGAEQKSTFCVAKGAHAWVSHHVGDLEHVATHEAFREGIAHFERLFAVTPAVVAHDLHPNYLSTTYGLARDGVDHVGVQHHHAHLAACLAEHGVWDAPAVGAIFDGTGYGLDGTVWGGELLIGGVTGFERAGSLRPVRMPGSAAAIRQPWRMAFAWLADSFGEPQPRSPALRQLVEPVRWDAMAQIAASPAVSPLTSSIGRLFDAVGALCGVVAEATYEGQAAVGLEAAAWSARAAGSHGRRLAPLGPRGSAGTYELEFTDGWVLDPRAAIQAIYADLVSGVDRRLVAAGFHDAVARATVAAVTGLASERGLATAVLSGGVFQNRLLLESVSAGLERAGLRVLIPERLPPNDGGISYGQAAVAAAMCS
jgi:hydrogenase maturation protein HypF